MGTLAVKGPEAVEAVAEQNTVDGLLSKHNLRFGLPAAGEISRSVAARGFVVCDNKNVEAEIIKGDLLDQSVDAIVNAWNRNIIPWWLLLPQGVSGAIKRRAGLQPFREVAKCGPIPLGQAVLTSAGKLPFRGIIHVAGINGFWRASEFSIRQSVRNAVILADQKGFKSIAFPVIGSGSGSFSQSKALEFMIDELSHIHADLQVKIVQYNR